MRGYKALFRALEPFAAERGARLIREVDVGLLLAWRKSWTWAPATQQTNLRLLKAFFRFATEQGWLEESPAAALRPPKVDSPPTMPLSKSEVRALVRAAAGQPREQALLLLLRYSGLAICHAATLPLAAVEGTEVTLRRAKSGELVLCELPAPVVDALARVTRPNGYYFWTGSSGPRAVADYWRKRLKEVAENALVRNFKPERLRDTFAVELLLRRGAPCRT